MRSTSNHRLKAWQKVAYQETPGQSEDQLLQIGMQHHQAGRLPQAEAIYQRVLQLAPGNPDALHFSGLIAFQLGNIGRAVDLISRALKIKPSSQMYFNLGATLRAQGNLEGAAENYRKALMLTPEYAEAHNNLGNVYKQQGKLEEAAGSLRRALSLRPDYAEAHNNLGNVYKEQGRLDEAVACFIKALSLKPEYAEAYNNLGNAYRDQGRLDEAITCFHRTLSLKPGSAEAHSNLGNTLQDQGKLEAAIASYQKALALRPDFAEAHNNLGNALKDQGKLDAAIASYQRALALKPESADTYSNLGIALTRLNRHDEAGVNYQKALSLKPDSSFILGSYLHSRKHSCDWDGIDDAVKELLDGVDAGKAVSDPFCLLATPSTLAQQKRCAEIYVRERFPESRDSFGNRSRYSHDRIRLGYFSSDYYNHATSYLIAELFERHDRSRFEVTGFSYGTCPNDGMRKRVSAALDRFVDVDSLSDHDIAALARNLEIDIAIDLKGFTTNSRTGIFASRPAPIQVNYLGYPGTMCAPYIDYLIADPTLIPAEDQQYYSEKIAYLPHTYQVNDSRKRISERQFTRNEAGLPDDGFVFCCFNNNFKLTPVIFDVWMQLLKVVEGSVLWLFESNAQSSRNLQNEAIKRGVAPERIVFARRMDLADHLARHRLADLFLDTPYYNAHTTASDALWAELPVVTRLGDTFAGRVAASLLNAIGLPELITHSDAEYLALALNLAGNPDKLAAIKEKLGKNRTSHPLFNTSLFTLHIEDAFTRMWKRHQESLLPDHIYVDK